MSWRSPARHTLRIFHPFPSALDAAATAALAAVAGGAPARVASLAGAMFLIQASIGTWNDIVDSAVDSTAGRSEKPLGSGLISRRAAGLLACGAGAAGLATAAMAGPAALVVASLGYGCGLVYDLALKRTAWSWLPFALGIPLLPVFAWVGAQGNVPGRLWLLVGMAVPAGAALAISNALADSVADERGGIVTVATRLGWFRALGVVAVLEITVGAVALVTASVGDSGRGAGGAIAIAIAAAGSLVIASGFAVSALRPHSRSGWAIQAIGFTILAGGWAMAAGGGGAA